MRSFLCLCLVAACGSDGSSVPTVDTPPPPPPGDGAPPADAPPSALPTGTVTNIRDLATCPQGAPAGARCVQVTVGGCTGLDSEPIDAVVALRDALAMPVRGTVVHFSGGGGEGFQGGGTTAYEQAGFRNVYVAWLTDWEQTQSLGILAGACRPATILRWVFDEPSLHAASRTTAFCGEGFSGGSGQLGYALAHYGLGDVLDYVNELSGPPFARIDLGCDGDAPATAPVCSTDATMRLPAKLDPWENNVAPATCGATNIPAAELARWRADSIAVGTVTYPKTEVQFYACTNRPTAVTAQGKLYFDLITAAASSYHCYTADDGCQGEALGTGARDAQDALIAGCVPRHQ